jgi:hypothetical protein
LRDAGLLRERAAAAGAEVWGLFQAGEASGVTALAAVLGLERVAVAVGALGLE